MPYDENAFHNLENIIEEQLGEKKEIRREEKKGDRRMRRRRLGERRL